MKYMKRSNTYKASNVVFNNETLEAMSYDWWVFTKVIGTKLIFNDYRYSNTTCRHQWKVRRLLRDLGLSISYEIEAPKGLQNLNSAINYHNAKIIQLKSQIEKKGSKRMKNVERQEQICKYERKIELVKELIKQGEE